MLTEIEEFILGENKAHDLMMLEKHSDYWLITVSPCYFHTVQKQFVFKNVVEQYEQNLTDEDEELGYPLPLLGFHSFLCLDGRWKFCLNACDVEWGFISDWPEKLPSPMGD